MRAYGIGLLASVALIAPIAANAASYNINGNFISSGNTTSPGSGAWTYGWSTTLGGTLNLFNTLSTETGNAGNPVSAWTDSANVSLGDPTVWNNSSGATFGLSSIVIPSGWTMFHPGNDLELTNIEFIAPSAGAYSINASFASGDTQGGAGTNVYVASLNGTTASTLFSSLVTGAATFNADGSPAAPVNYNGVVNLAAGQIVDFAVDPHGASPAYNDSTLLQGTITPVPLPGALWLMLSGLAGLGAMARQRKAAQADPQM